MIKPTKLQEIDEALGVTTSMGRWPSLMHAANGVRLLKSSRGLLRPGLHSVSTGTLPNRPRRSTP